MSRRRTFAAIALAGALVVTACSGDDDDEATSEATTPATAGDATVTGDEDGDDADGGQPSSGPPDAEPVDADLGSAMWVFNDVALETNDFWRGADDGRLRNWQLFPGTPAIAVADSADGHVALVSDDLINFRPVHRGCCGFTLADRLDDRIVIVAVGPDGASAFASPDGGVTWTAHDLVLPGGAPDAPFRPIDVVVSTTGYLATGAPALATVPSPATVWFSDDLETWTPVALPDVPPAMPEQSSISLRRAVDDSIWVVAALNSFLDRPRVVPFRTADGGRTFESLPSLDASPEALGAVGDRLVLWPSRFDRRTGGGVHPWVLIPDTGWVRAPVDNGQWGDGRVFVRSPALDRGTGRFVAYVQRSLRATPDACFVAPDACGEIETALVTSSDGLKWRDVDAPAWEAPDAGAAFEELPAIAATGNDGWLIWQPSTSSDDVTAHRWTGPAPVTTFDPAEYAVAPESPYRLYTDGPIATGETVRYVLTGGGCASNLLIGGRWDVSPEVPTDPPSGWPARPGREADGPSIYLYGELERVALDRMIFSMDGVDLEFTLTPSAESSTGCG